MEHEIVELVSAQMDLRTKSISSMFMGHAGRSTRHGNTIGTSAKISIVRSAVIPQLNYAPIWKKIRVAKKPGIGKWFS